MLPKSDGKRQGAISIRLLDRSRWMNIKIYSNGTNTVNLATTNRFELTFLSDHLTWKEVAQLCVM